jgi:hypothetical protein
MDILWFPSFVTIFVRPNFPNNGYIVVPYLCDSFMTKNSARLFIKAGSKPWNKGILRNQAYAWPHFT